MTVPEYTVMAAAGAAAVVVAETAWLRTAIFRRPQYWATMAIVFAFQCLTAGWLTKLSAPVVIYRPGHSTGWRFPWDIPVEDFLFGFALITLVLSLWVRAGSEART